MQVKSGCDSHQVIPVMDNEGLEATCGLRFDPVLEDEAQDSTGHLRAMLVKDAYP